MKIIISPEWLKTCGKSDLAGVELEAHLDESKSWSRMGSYYHITDARAPDWGVFHCRGVDVVSI